MIRKRIFEILEPAKSDDHHSRIFDSAILVVIIINIICVILESFQSIAVRYKHQLDIIELVSIIIFTAEYLLRILTSDLLYKNSNQFKSAIKFIKSPMAVIDFIAIIPFYLPMLIAVDLRFLRILRLTRILRVLKVSRYTSSLNMIARVLKRKREELIVTLFVTSLLLILAASIMYIVESDVQPDGFPNIIAALWWAVATLTTVGYGDLYPLTFTGKLLSGIIALLGIGLVALPTGIISNGFTEELERKKESYNRSAKAYKYKKRRKTNSHKKS